MFRAITILVVAMAAGFCLAHYLACARRRGESAGGTALGAGTPARPAPRDLRRFTIWERLVHLAVTGSFLVLAGTGFWAVLSGQERLSGWLLLVHVTCGGVFAVAMALMSLRWAWDCRFAAHDAGWCPLKACRGGQDRPAAGKFDAAQKAFFWLAVLLGLAVALTMMLSMTALFGQEGMGLLLELHRYSGLGLLAAVIVHSYLKTLGRSGTWRAMLDGKVSRDWAGRHHGLWLDEMEQGR